MSRAAVVVNPVKIPASFRAQVDAVMAEHGWSEPLWLETTREDQGQGQARTAATAGVDLVLACGGDGTVTATATGLAGTSIPLAVIPLGTGNLLARNLGLPINLSEALTIALTGRDRRVDAGRANGRLFLTMAGLGLDAKMLAGASETVKKRLGWGAYVAAVLRHLWDRPMRVRLQTDAGPPLRRRASEIIVGNVGALQGGLPLLPAAEPDDGQLDLVVLTARTVVGWLAVAAHVLRPRSEGTARVLRRTCTELRVDVDREYLWEIDGELMGRTRQLVVTIEPAVLVVRVPVDVRSGETA